MKRFLVVLILLSGIGGFFANAQHPCGDGTTYAVIVGVSRYQISEADLQYSDDDAMSICKIFKRLIPEQNIILLTNEEATCSAIKSAASRLFSKAGSSDRIFFYFSGHGDNGMFFPHDVNYGGENALTHDDLKGIFKSSAARTKFIIADACLAGTIRTPPKTTGGNSGNTEDVNVVVFMSSRGSQYSNETSKLHQGVFTYYLDRGLSGKADANRDRIITIKELFDYTHDRVAKETENKQVPVVWGKFRDDLPVLCW